MESSSDFERSDVDIAEDDADDNEEDDTFEEDDMEDGFEDEKDNWFPPFTRISGSWGLPLIIFWHLMSFD